MPTDTLPGTGNKNERREDSKTNDNMDNDLTSNVYLNDQTTNFFQSSRLETKVDAGDKKVN